MSPAASPLPSPRPRGGLWRRVLFVLFAVCLAVGGVLFYDAPLKPWGDTSPVAENERDPEENGYLYLQREWASTKGEGWLFAARAATLTSRAQPWDEARIAKMRAGGGKAVADIRRAAALPRWVPSLIEKTKRGSWAASPQAWLTGRSALIALEACAAARAGDTETAFEIWKAQHAAATRQIAGGRDLLNLRAGLELRRESAELACDLLEWLREDDSLLERLEEHWREDPFTDAVAETALRGDLRWLWAELDRSGPLGEGDLPDWRASSRLLLKKNMTMNRCNDLFRIFGGRLLTPVPTREASVSLALENAGRSGSPVSPNYFGNRMVSWWARSTGGLFRGELSVHRFIPRAMRVRLALQRWRLARGETPPAALEELVPEFLKEIPADPWTGGPLGWKAADWTVSALGRDWRTDSFGRQWDVAEWRAWIHTEPGRPALRAKLPAKAATSPLRPPLRKTPAKHCGRRA